MILLKPLLIRVRNGHASVPEALKALADLPYQDLGFAKLDHHRVLRRGLPEAVFGPGKSPKQIAVLARELSRHGNPVIVTKTDEKAYQLVRRSCPSAIWHPRARLIVVPGPRSRQRLGPVMVITAGTSDLPIAEEAAVTLETLGVTVRRVFDVGVAGLHRLLRFRRDFTLSKVIIVVAGMDGALPSVVAGLVRAPVVAVPTSVGYGASFRGIGPLLSMMNSCSPGVAVVNIDNGFGAGYLATVILGVRS